MCLSYATKCDNKRKMISECEKEYLVEIKRIIGETDKQRYLAATSKKEMER